MTKATTETRPKLQLRQGELTFQLKTQQENFSEGRHRLADFRLWS